MVSTAYLQEAVFLYKNAGAFVMDLFKSYWL